MTAGTKGIIAGVIVALLLSPLVFVACEALAVFAAWFTWDVLEMRIAGPGAAAVGGGLCGAVSAVAVGLVAIVLSRTAAVRLL